MVTARRRREWVTLHINEVTADGELDTRVLLPEIPTVPGGHKGETLVRLIIGLDIMGDAIVNDSIDIMDMTMGVGIVGVESGVSAIDPAEVDEVPASGWMWFARYQVGETWDSAKRIDLDIRAQRKLLYGEPRLILAANLNSGTAFAVETVGTIRALYLLE